MCVKTNEMQISNGSNLLYIHHTTVKLILETKRDFWTKMLDETYLLSSLPLNSSTIFLKVCIYKDSTMKKGPLATKLTETGKDGVNEVTES